MSFEATAAERKLRRIFMIEAMFAALNNDADGASDDASCAAFRERRLDR